MANKLYLVVCEDWFGGRLWCRNVNDPITRCDGCQAELFDVRIFSELKDAESHIKKYEMMNYEECVFHGQCAPDMIIVEIEKPIEDKIYLVVSENPYGGYMDHPCRSCGEKTTIRVFGSDVAADDYMDEICDCKDCSKEYIVCEWQL